MKPIRGEPMGMDIALGVVIDQIRREQGDIAVIERVESYF
jgi:hypothetical protein